MRNTIQTTQNISLALKSDSHLSTFKSYVEIKDKTIVVNGYAYIDYIIEDFSALFYFIPFDKNQSDDWDLEDIKEVRIEFEEQRLYSTDYDHARGIIQSERYKVIDTGHEAFNLDEALKDAEYKAFDLITN